MWIRIDNINIHLNLADKKYSFLRLDSDYFLYVLFKFFKNSKIFLYNSVEIVYDIKKQILLINEYYN